MKRPLVQSPPLPRHASPEVAGLLLGIFLLAGCGAGLPATEMPAIPTPTPPAPGTSLRQADDMLMLQVQGALPPGSSQPLPDFWFDLAEVSQRQYLVCLEAGACDLSPVCRLAADAEVDPALLDEPFTCARWSDVKTYCEWAGGRLPTESEWEAAALLLEQDMIPWGDPQFGFRCVVQAVSSLAGWPTRGWITSSPQAQGLDAGLIEQGLLELKNTFPNPHSVLIVRHGYLVVEEYYQGYRPGRTQDVASVNKSFLSALVGIAIDRGIIPGVDVKMMDYFPGQPPQDDPRLYEITLEHLLTMTSGFYWPETEPVFPSWVEDAFLSGFPQDALFHSPIIYNPGTTFSYCTACTHLLSIILQEASGMLAQDFAQQYLMSPLGISAEEWSWNRIGGGHNSGGWGFYLTPRSMAKLGYLYLQEGEWDGLQVIPRDWVRQSRRSLVDDYYGYLWWVTMINGHPAFYANGHGGQYIYIFPSLDMVIVITQETRLHNGGEPTEILHDYFTPAVIAP